MNLVINAQPSLICTRTITVVHKDERRGIGNKTQDLKAQKRFWKLKNANLALKYKCLQKY